MSDFIWPSDAARAENPDLNRVCEELEDVLDELDDAKSTPYQLAVHELKDALDHIQRMALASRTQTRRLRRIAARANAALEAREFDPAEAKSLKDARTPQSYELELRVLNRELAESREREAALAANVERLRSALNYSSEYLYGSHLNTIGHGSKAHMEMLSALEDTPATSLARRDDDV